MSDISDDDELANYGPTTPAPPPKKGRPRAGSVRPVAGPSKPPNKTAAAKKNNTKPVPIVLDGEESGDIEFVDPPAKKRRGTHSEEEDQEDARPAKGGAKKAAGRAAANTNGAPQAVVAAKGKARANSVRANGAFDDPSDVNPDDMEVVDDVNPPAPRAPRPGPKTARKVASNGAIAARHARTEERLQREIEDLRMQLEQSRESAKEIAAQRDKLATQLEDVFHVRQTDAEQALKEYKARFDESMKRKEGLIQELTAQVGKLQSPSSKSAQSYSLHFLTREAADEEKHALSEENNTLKEELKQRDDRIFALTEELKTLRVDLDAEIQRSTLLASRAPGPVVPSSSRPTREESKNAPVIRLYEDMTNILVTSVKSESNPEWPDIDEEVFSCIYTYDNPQADLKFSLSFSLRNYFDRPEGMPTTQRPADNQFTQKVRYTPKDLYLHPNELVERLGFFKDAFAFSRDQMTVFLKTLTESVSAVFEADDGDADSSDIVDVTPRS